MAIGHLPEPGSEFALGGDYGPCVDECDHSDCPGLRDWLSAQCFVCHEPIGERGYYDTYYDHVDDVPFAGRFAYMVHAFDCFEMLAT